MAAAAATAALASAVSILLLLPPHVFPFDPSALVRSNPSTGRRQPIVFPLFSSAFNSSCRAVLRSRSTAEARMRLYDNLTEGYYSARLYIGTPPQKFQLIVDTGSTITYVPCSTCVYCGIHQDPRFRPDSSTTYSPIKCNVNCTCDKAKNQCSYETTYAEMSSSSGVLGVDVMSFGSESSLVPQPVVFGCENTESGYLYTQRADGIIGLGHGDNSIMDQLVEKGVIGNSFSLCYGGMSIGGGAMVLGEIPTIAGMVFASSLPNSQYYNIDLMDMEVSGERLHLDSVVFDSGTILDSGTTYAYIPEVAFIALKEAIMRHAHTLLPIPGPDPNYNDFCFSGAARDISELPKNFPELALVFAKGQKITLTPENYLFQHSKVHGAYCLGIFKNEENSPTLLGGIIVRNTLVTYDRKNNRIGFLKTNCSELLKKLDLIDAPPSSSPRVQSPLSSPYDSKTSGKDQSASSPAMSLLAPAISLSPPAISPTRFLYQFQKGHGWTGMLWFCCSVFWQLQLSVTGVF